MYACVRGLYMYLMLVAVGQCPGTGAMQCWEENSSPSTALQPGGFFVWLVCCFSLEMFLIE